MIRVMKISVVASRRGWHTKELEKTAKKMGIALAVKDITSLNNQKKEAKKLGDVIIWRSSSLDKFSGRTAFLSSLKNKIIINYSIINQPFLANKFYQQRYFERYSGIDCIPTYKFKTKKDFATALARKEIRLPIILKPELGSQGKNIILIKSKKGINSIPSNLEKYIFQPFVKNEGDYRVLMLGGRALGAIKRTSAQKSFLNNLAQGGTAEKVTDSAVLKKLYRIASKVVSTSGLTFCGVDIIYDVEKKKYYFLEVNTVPEWKGFQSKTGVNVAREIFLFCQDIYSRENKSTFQIVKSYYEKNYSALADKKFHYASRMYLWTRDRVELQRLKELEAAYLGSEYQLRKKIKDLSQTSYDYNYNPLHKNIRQKYFVKYPRLMSFNRLLFKVLFADIIYKRDLRPFVGELIKDNALMRLKARLEKDRKAIAILSTHAINFFYLLENYFGRSNNKNFIEPTRFYAIGTTIYKGKLKKYSDLQVYLLTHCIIGESLFYNQKIKRNKNVYIQMTKFIEKLIGENYFDISLDNKLEFLICAELCQYHSPIRILILSEAERSLAQNGNFVTDILNTRSHNQFGDSFIFAEHRNVLYLMANQKFALNPVKKPL